MTSEPLDEKGLVQRLNAAADGIELIDMEKRSWRRVYENILREAADRIASLMRERDEARDGAKFAERIAAKREVDAEARANAAEREAERLRGVLEPFAEAADNLDESHPDNTPIWEAPAAMGIDAKHLREARTALSQHGTMPEGGEDA